MGFINPNTTPVAKAPEGPTVMVPDSNPTKKPVFPELISFLNIDFSLSFLSIKPFTIISTSSNCLLVPL